MFRLLIEKELKHIILGPKFTATFLVCSILILLSVFVGIRDYQAAVRQHDAAVQLQKQELDERHTWAYLRTRVYRKPDPMQIFVSGISNDIGRLSVIGSTETVRLRSSIYSEDTVFAFFRTMDLMFIVQVVLSLFAILFTFNTVNGERENGTLQLTFANPVSRVRYILAKFAGSWLGLVVPLTVPVLLGLLLLQVFGVPMTAVLWAKLSAFLGVSLLYFTFFIGLGVFVSSCTRHASLSFLVLLVIWVTAVLIVPRAGLMTAGKIMPVPSAAEVEGRIDGYSKTRWDTHIRELGKVWQRRSAEMENMDADERKAYRERKEWEWMEEEDQYRKKVQTDIREYSDRIYEDLENRKQSQKQLAFGLSRFSPSSCYQLAAMNLAGTDVGLETRSRTDMSRYQQDFVDLADRMNRETGGHGGGIRISIDTDTGIHVETPDQDKTIDTSLIPRFQGTVQPFEKALKGALLDSMLLFLFTAGALAAGFFCFMRYDIRQ
jgi:ABC-type transport system involved in multi-copper enzyme maturation permease subunit